MTNVPPEVKEYDRAYHEKYKHPFKPTPDGLRYSTDHYCSPDRYFTYRFKYQTAHCHSCKRPMTVQITVNKRFSAGIRYSWQEITGWKVKWVRFFHLDVRDW